MGDGEGLRPDARVLVVRLSALGDVVFALPAVQALRHLLPQARVEWLVEDRHAEVLRGHPAVDRVLVFPRSEWSRATGLRRLRAVGRMADHLLRLGKEGRYDLALDFQGNLKSAMHLLFARAALTVGYDRPAAREGAHRFVGMRVPDPGRVHRSERDLALVRALGYTGPAPPPAPWPLDRQVESEVAQRLDHFLSVPERAREGGPVVLLHTTVTDYGRDKAWPGERWLALAKGLAEGVGARVLLLWSESNRSQVLARAEASGGCAGLAPPTPTLAHLMALTDRAAVLVGTDSGPLHLAAYRGTPVVGLFGPTDPVRYAPLGPRVKVVGALPEGEEPPRRDRSGPSPLMERIQVGAVLEGVEAMLAGTLR